MIIYLWGKDSYRRSEKAKEIIEEYKKKHSAFSMQSFDFQEDGAWESFKGAVNAVSLFDNFKFLIAKNLMPIGAEIEKEAKEVLEKIHSVKETILLVVADDEPNKKFSFILDKPSMVQEFEELVGSQFESFIKIESAKANLRLTPNILRELGATYQGNNWAVVSAIKSLSTNPQAVIGEKPRVSANIFPEAMAALKASSFKVSLPIIERLLIREDAAYVFNMLASISSINDKKVFADYDVAIKSGKLDYETAITDWAIKM